MSVIALDLGGTKLSAGVFDENGNISHRQTYALSGRQGAEVGNLIKEVINNILQGTTHERINVSGIGICVPGISYEKTGHVWAPNIPGWEDFPLKDEIERIVLHRNIKVIVDNDRACSVLGEKWKGVAQNCNHVIFLAVGTGIGAGILINGEVLRGAEDIAGATGWMALNKPFEDKYKPFGCFEYYASGDGLVRAAKEFIQQDAGYHGILKKYIQLSARDIFSNYENDDVIAQKVITQAVQFWGMATANFVSLFNPDKIIFGGGVFGPASKFLSEIKEEAFKWAQPVSIQQVEIETSALGNDAALFGAAFRAF